MVHRAHALCCVFLFASACAPFGTEAPSEDGGAAPKDGGSLQSAPIDRDPAASCAPALLCLDFESPPPPPWSAQGDDRGRFISLLPSRTGRAAHALVTNPVSARRDAFAAPLNLAPEKGVTIALDLRLAQMPNDQYVVIGELLGEKDAYTVHLVLEGRLLRLAESSSSSYRIHGAAATLGTDWSHVELRLFGASTNATLVVGGVAIETDKPFVAVPAGGPGLLRSLVLGIVETDDAGADLPVELEIDNVRVTSP